VTATSPSAWRRRRPRRSPSPPAFGIWQARSVVILLLLAVTFAAAIRPGVEWLGRHRVPQSVAILLHFVVVGAAVGLLLWLAVPPALHQIAQALDQNATAGPQADHGAGVGDRVLAWLQQNLRQLPSGKELLHPVATYGHKAGEAVVAVFFTLAATWYCVSEERLDHQPAHRPRTGVEARHGTRDLPRGQTVGLSPLVTLLSVAVVGVLFGGFAVVLAVPFTSAVATIIDVLVLGHEPPAEQPRRSLRLRR
jgi:predicted PurR-regulated permease PerM